MRFAALLFVAALLPAAACEVAFPFDRSLIAPDAGSGFGDSGSVADDTGAPIEDAQRPGDGATDASDDTGDAGVASDATLDGVADGPPAADFDATADAVADARDGSD